MDAPARFGAGDGVSHIHVVNPPADLKPEGDFKRLLAEYRLWIRQNQDKGYSVPLSAFHAMAFSEELPWKVRQMIRQMGDQSSPRPKDHRLKWHLILHLARESEESLVEAEEMLLKIKQGKSALNEALGDEASSLALFEDLPPYDTPSSFNARYLPQVFEAWLGLFGDHIPNNGWLVTLDRNVMNYAKEIFKDENISILPKDEVPSCVRPYSDQTHSCPECVQLPQDDRTVHTDPIFARLSGKRIILFVPP